MFRKVLFTLLFVAFAGWQLANTLECYICYNNAQCQVPQLRQCTNEIVNHTRQELGHYYANVSEINYNTDFQCIYANWTYANYSNAFAIYGCTHMNDKTCHMKLKPEYAKQPMFGVCGTATGTAIPPSLSN